MLYTPFRKTLRRYDRAARAFDAHIGPDSLEVPSREVGALMEIRDSTEKRMRELLRYYPETPPDGFGENGQECGPVIHPDDVRVAASIQLPLALSLGKDFPTESYGPAAFLRIKCVLLASTLEVYTGWRAYTIGEHRTDWQGFPPQIPNGAFSSLSLVSTQDRHLATLFANLKASADRCRKAIKFQFGESIHDL